MNVDLIVRPHSSQDQDHNSLAQTRDREEAEALKELEGIMEQSGSSGSLTSQEASIIQSPGLKVNIQREPLVDTKPVYNTPAVVKESSEIERSLKIKDQQSIYSRSKKSKVSYKDVLASPEMKHFRKKMQKKLSGIDIIEMKQFNKEVMEVSEQKFFDSKSKINFLKTKMQKFDLTDEMDHMFVDENALEPEQKTKKKKSMWTHVFDAVSQWPKHQVIHSQQVIIDEIRENEEKMKMPPAIEDNESIKKSKTKLEKTIPQEVKKERPAFFAKIQEELDAIVLQESLSQERFKNFKAQVRYKLPRNAESQLTGYSKIDTKWDKQVVMRKSQINFINENMKTLKKRDESYEFGRRYQTQSQPPSPDSEKVSDSQYEQLGRQLLESIMADINQSQQKLKQSLTNFKEQVRQQSDNDFVENLQTYIQNKLKPKQVKRRLTIILQKHKLLSNLIVQLNLALKSYVLDMKYLQLDQVMIMFAKDRDVLQIVRTIVNLVKYFKVKNDFSYRTVIYQKMKKTLTQAAFKEYSPQHSLSNYQPAILPQEKLLTQNYFTRMKLKSANLQTRQNRGISANQNRNVVNMESMKPKSASNSKVQFQTFNNVNSSYDLSTQVTSKVGVSRLFYSLKPEAYSATNTPFLKRKIYLNSQIAAQQIYSQKLAGLSKK